MQGTKEIKIGNLYIGKDHPIIIQSMTNTKTKDVAKTVSQIEALVKAGAQMVRVTVTDEDDAKAIKEIKKFVQIPIVADIHFDYKLAIMAVMAGVDKIRINPGNIGSFDKVKAIIEVCKDKHIPIRIGINSGSLEKSIYEKYGKASALALIESISNYVEYFEKLNFYDIVLSVKATDLSTTIEANRLLKKRFNYPIHIGLTEAGSFTAGTVRSSYALGTLLSEGIGDTIRISLTGDPVKEIMVAKEILAMFNLYQKPLLISCPTCGRTNYDMTSIVEEIEPFLNSLSIPLKVAIMGCAVNGPGEAKDADIGIAGGIGEVLLFKKGKVIRKIPEEFVVNELKKEILNMIEKD